MTERERFLEAEAGELFGLVCGLDAELRQMRALCARILFAAVERRELLAFAEAAAERRFPTSGASS